jgi:hypothetical protein
MSDKKKQNIIFIIENDDDDNEERSPSNNTYYQRNKDTIKEKYAQKADKARAYQVEYNLINNEQYTAYQKNYYCQKREEILESKKEKVVCECGKMVSLGHMTCHKKTAIHLKRLNSKI